MLIDARHTRVLEIYLKDTPQNHLFAEFQVKIKRKFKNLSWRNHTTFNLKISDSGAL